MCVTSYRIILHAAPPWLELIAAASIPAGAALSYNQSFYVIGDCFRPKERAFAMTLADFVKALWAVQLSIDFLGKRGYTINIVDLQASSNVNLG
jgi:hypothetical protein